MRPRLHTALRIGSCVAALAVAFATTPAYAGDLAELPRLNAAPAESSVSGISSGAFMAVQFGTAWSSTIKGVGVISGGPYFCAQGEVAEAVGACMKGPAPDLALIYNTAVANEGAGAIDPLKNLASQKIYVFHGFNDAVVAQAVTDATVAFYRHYQGDADKGNLFYQSSIGAGHSFVVLNAEGASAQALNACKDNREPYIDQCGYDQAGILLQHFYGALNARNSGALTGSLKSFSQTTYMGSETPDAVNMAAEGFVFVPKACEEGAACRVHVALHGCKQNADTLGRTFVENTGYLNWADTNRIVVLFPQTKASRQNPAACWDWWGYTGAGGGYVTKSARQITVIKAMLDALTSGTKPDGAAGTERDAAVDGAPFHAVVTDVSDTSAALAWPVVQGAQSYRVTRLAVDGSPVFAASVSAPGFGDSGLAPSTEYRWRVSAVVNGTEGPIASEVSAMTRPTPAPCATPGMCPLMQSAN